MTGMIECRYYGRDFTADEMALLRALIAADPQPTRAASTGRRLGCGSDEPRRDPRRRADAGACSDGAASFDADRVPAQ